MALRTECPRPSDSIPGLDRADSVLCRLRAGELFPEPISNLTLSSNDKIVGVGRSIEPRAVDAAFAIA